MVLKKAQKWKLLRNGKASLLNNISIIEILPSLFRSVFLLVILCFAIGCSNENHNEDEAINDMYFPPTNTALWETISPAELHWNMEVLTELEDFLETNNTRAFLILKNGRIVVENYWGQTILNNADFNQKSKWYWASAGKSLTATLVGIARQEGFLDINAKTNEYLGPGWTALPADKEDLIKVHHQLSMTTGLDYQLADLDCTIPDCLKYATDAGNQWFYHNAPYSLLEEVVVNATATTYNQFTAEYLGRKIGMNGTWIKSGYNNVFWSTAREAARFGLLIQNKGTWYDSKILKDENYFAQMTQSSQELNPSYGYLWWLNGKNKVILPGFSASVSRSLCPDAPTDLIAAMGKNGQFIEIIPSKGLVIVRMGEAPGEAVLPIVFHDEMWEILERLL